MRELEGIPLLLDHCNVDDHNPCILILIQLISVIPTRGGTPLYEVYKYVPPQRVWFLSRFGLKTGIDFEHFGLKLSMVIEGTFTKAYKLIFLPSNRR